jgi:acetyl-CoA carboxylase biotin carboxyl carrier protein
MDLARLQALIDLVASTPITELDLTEGELRVRITKVEPGPSATSGTTPPRSFLGQPPVAAPAAAKLMRAPMAGTFFTTPSPSDPPFVQPGDPVVKGATVCIIEVMKTLTRVPADQNGTLLKVLAMPGAFVEYNQPLFEIG